MHPRGPLRQQGPEDLALLTYFVRPLRVTSTTTDAAAATPAAGGATAPAATATATGSATTRVAVPSGTAKAAVSQAPSFAAQGVAMPGDGGMVDGGTAAGGTIGEDPAVAARVNAAIGSAGPGPVAPSEPADQRLATSPVSSSRPVGTAVPLVVGALLAGAATGLGLRLRLRRRT